ncbi:hypothetical protein AB7074_17375, partial [Klebsiella pneumoniae]|uniref:hypothetical protein n=1 Tax=Klebsiella pneumoniae TaxID=573 RepID=UPI001C3CCB50
SPGVVALQNSHTTIPKAHPEKLCRFYAPGVARIKKGHASSQPVNGCSPIAAYLYIWYGQIARSNHIKHGELHE